MSGEQEFPKWGDPIESIPQERRAELRALADKTRTGDPFAFADETLNGAEVYFLLLNSLAGPIGDYASAERKVADDTHFSVASSLCLRGANLSYAHLEDARLDEADLKDVNFFEAHLERANLEGANLQRANLVSAHLEDAVLLDASLDQADLGDAHLEGAILIDAHLQGASLQGAFFSAATDLSHAVVSMRKHTISVADVRWQGANLAVIDWPKAMVLGEERLARVHARAPLSKPGSSIERLPKDATPELRRKVKDWRQEDLLSEWRTAARANRQMAVVMREQGMTEESDRFAYRAQLCERELLYHHHRWAAWTFSTLLWATAGYGYRLWRILASYVGVLLVFTLLYWVGGVHSHHEPSLHALLDSFLVSLTAIHGRTTFEQLGAWTFAAWVAAIESVFGIVIEGIFVAMLIQRFFAR